MTKKCYNQSAKIVLGCLFGDEGKGRTVDYLFSQPHLKSYDSIVVRFSGGHQVGHTVMMEDNDEVKKHIHSNFGSGTLRGVSTFYTEHCTVYPNTFRNELDVLNSLGVAVPTIFTHPLTMVTTPYDVAYNRTEEICRGRHKHGSVGLGFGSTIDRNTNTGYKLHMIDTLHEPTYWMKMAAIESYYKKKISENDYGFQHTYLSELEKLEPIFFFKHVIIGYDFLRNFQTIVFEGSQGILLDKDHGIFPNVTYSNTTSKVAMELCKMLGIDDIEIFYVSRCYQTRHGKGWMSSEGGVELINNEEETCTENEYQGGFRIGEFDYDLINYAIEIDKIYSLGADPKFVLTCCDQRPDFVLDENKLAFKFADIIKTHSPIN